MGLSTMLNSYIQQYDSIWMDGGYIHLIYTGELMSNLLPIMA